jgi:hypothetical protein
MRKALQTAVEYGVSLLDAMEQTCFEGWKDARQYESEQGINAKFVYREMVWADFDQ